MCKQEGEQELAFPSEDMESDSSYLTVKFSLSAQLLPLIKRANAVLQVPWPTEDISFSDHFFITANINLPAPSSATDIISFRPKNLLNPLKLSECISSSPLTGTLPSSVDNAVTLYNGTLTHIIDNVALLTTRTVKKD
ncbi:UNVERIFIED_CONTAM: hypothetical protein FKN15_008184 [Acipenser sinensis]